MSTINISLPAKQANIIDSLVDKYGFANRSEFIRSVLRVVMHNSNLLEKAAVYPFVSVKKESAKTIVSAFSKSGRYSKKFLKDLKEGLVASEYYQS